MKYFFKYLKYLFRSQNLQQIHSPFVFQWVQDVVYNERLFYDFFLIEKYRKSLCNSNATILIEDFGTGSKAYNNNNYKIIIAKHAKRISIPEKYGRLLFRIINSLQPENSIELGTGFGISTLYMHLAFKKGNFYTFEGSPSLVKIDNEIFQKFSLKTLKVIPGNFDFQLPPLLYKINKIDFVFIDGNHIKEAVIGYIKFLLPKVNENTIVIIDDINWSEDMESAWTEIKKLNEISITIDLFRLGIIFFKKGIEKQDFLIHF